MYKQIGKNWKRLKRMRMEQAQSHWTVYVHGVGGVVTCQCQSQNVNNHGQKVVQIMLMIKKNISDQ